MKHLGFVGFNIINCSRNRDYHTFLLKLYLQTVKNLLESFQAVHLLTLATANAIN